jgi:hypothetical protein
MPTKNQRCDGHQGKRKFKTMNVKLQVKGKVNSRHIQRLATIQSNAEVNESERVQNHETTVENQYVVATKIQHKITKLQK